MAAITRAQLERRRQLESKIEKLRALGTSPEANEASSANSIADRLQLELDALPKAPTQVMSLDKVPLVHGGALTPVSHRYFQVAAFSARWSGLLLHVSHELLIFPRGYLYGPKRVFPGARRKFEQVKEKLDEKLQAWVDEQGREMSSEACDAYARSFLLGLDETLSRSEPPKHKLEREARWELVVAAYRVQYERDNEGG